MLVGHGTEWCNGACFVKHDIRVVFMFQYGQSFLITAEGLIGYKIASYRQVLAVLED